MSLAPRGRRLRTVLVTLAAAALPVAVLAMPSTASADGVTGAGSGTTTVYQAQDVCGAPASGQATCFAERLVAKRVAAGSAAARSAPVRSDAGRGPAGGFTSTQLARAYGVNANTDASDQVVAIVGAYHSPRLLQHLATFDARYGFAKESSATVRVINGADGSTRLPTQTDAGWAGEADLDVQAVRGICRTCKILVVETAGPGNNRLAKGVDTAVGYTWVRRDGVALDVDLVTNSYGGSERTSTAATNQGSYDHPGVAILASAGDSGWFDWDYARTNHPEYVSNSANLPASYPGVVGVGGTTLKVSTSDQRTIEYVWNRDGNEGSARTGGATGSGCSEVFDANSWQASAAGYDSLGCSPNRASSVDIAALADPYTGYDIYTTGGWATFGGTSLSSPLVAGLWALAGGPQGVARPEQTLYQHFAAGTGLYDVTYGGNGACGTDSANACANEFGDDPNTFGYGPIDCKFAWTSPQGVEHQQGSGTYQCNARAGLDGPSGVGAPSGSTVFRP